MITAVVPVKTYSERLPRKNLSPFLDTTLYEYKLKQLAQVPFDSIVVSSEAREVLWIARKYGFSTHLRNPKYSTSSVPMSKVWSYIASEIRGTDIAWVNVTNPLFGPNLYKKALEMYRYKRDYDCLLSVYNLQKYVWWKGKPVNFQPYPHPRSQDLKGLYAQSFAINICPRRDLIERGTSVGEKPLFFVTDTISGTKIDYKADLDFCEMMVRRRQS